MNTAMASKRSRKESSDCFFCGCVAFPVSSKRKHKTARVTQGQAEKNIGLNLFCNILCSTDNFNPIRNTLIGADSCGTCDMRLRDLAASVQLMEKVKDSMAQSVGALLKNVKGHFEKLKYQSQVGKVTGVREGLRENLNFILEDIAGTGFFDGSVEKIGTSVFKLMTEMEEDSQKNARVSQNLGNETQRDVDLNEGVETGVKQAMADSVRMPPPPPKMKRYADVVYVPTHDVNVSDWDEGGDKDEGVKAIRRRIH